MTGAADKRVWYFEEEAGETVEVATQQAAVEVEVYAVTAVAVEVMVVVRMEAEGAMVVELEEVVETNIQVALEVGIRKFL